MSGIEVHNIDTDIKHPHYFILGAEDTYRELIMQWLASDEAEKWDFAHADDVILVLLFLTEGIDCNGRIVVNQGDLEQFPLKVMDRLCIK